MFARVFTVATFAATMLLGVAFAHEGHDHEHDVAPDPVQPAGASDKSDESGGPHGGALQAVGTIQVETLIEPSGLRVFVYDGEGQPLDVGQARGVASLQVRGDSKRYRYDLFAVTGRGRSADSLAAAVDLSRIAGSQVDVKYQLVGLPGNDRQPIRFHRAATVPMTNAQLTVIPATKEDEAAIALQKICPVMDEPLGSMGTPLKVVGLERDVYLCCKGCLKFLEKEPEKYLAKLLPLPKTAKPVVVKAAKEDAQFVAAQKSCPVMDKPLDAMGGPWKTVVEGRIVYLCCPGCAKKLHAEPQVFFEKLAGLGVTPPIAR